jgi:DNA-binding NarL/FixJ family response regulator
VREGITRALESMEGVELVGTGVDLDSLRECVERVQPDVVLTDIRMPPTRTDEGIRFAADLKLVRPEVGVVVLSQHADPVYAQALFAEGADRRGYLLKERLKDKQELQQALTAIAGGGSWVDSRVVERLLDDGRGRTPHLDELSPREAEILAMIAKGLSNSGIAEQLSITRRAVERHINAIFRKLDLRESDEDTNRRVRATLLFLAGERD